mgnify:CR=1 FL=1
MAVHPTKFALAPLGSQRPDYPPLRVIVLPGPGDHRVVIGTLMRIHVLTIALLLHGISYVTQGGLDRAMRVIVVPVQSVHRVVIGTLMR